MIAKGKRISKDLNNTKKTASDDGPLVEKAVPQKAKEDIKGDENNKKPLIKEEKKESEAVSKVPEVEDCEIQVKFFNDRITKDPRVMKKIPKAICTKGDIQTTEGINLLKSLDHPNIPRVYEINQDSKSYYVITEKCTGGVLFDTLASMTIFTERQAAIIMRQILSAVAYCHQKGIYHL